MVFMLDTDAASYLIKRRIPSVDRKVQEIPPEQVCISAVTRAELMYGLRRLPPDHRLHAGVGAFLRLTRTLPWDGDAADRYAEIRHRLASGGQTIGELDTMIAAHALAVDATLVTNNTRHFARIGAPLALANWWED